MSLRVVSVAPPLVSLFFFSAFVIAGGVNVTATCTDSNLFWTYNSISQSPCLVAAYMFSTCLPGIALVVGPLAPGGAYGPASNNKCECSTVGYSLISACAACQDAKPLDWLTYVANCTSTLPPAQFPNPVPPGAYVPHWAILDVTNENNWSANESHAAGDNPEYGPGAIFGPSGVYTSSASSSASSAASSTAPSTAPSTASSTARFTASSAARSTASSTSSHSGSHTGAITGGVIGVIVIIYIAVATIFFLRRRRLHAAPAGVDLSQPMLNDETVVQSSSGPPLTMRLYDPDDPTTFPEYQDDPQSLDIRSASLSSPVRSGRTLSDMQTSLAHAGGYHGLPMPSA